MLCRSTSTGVLSTLLPAVSSHLQAGIFDQNERSTPDLYQNYNHAHVSTPRSGLQSPASKYSRPAADVMSRSTDGGDWEFEGETGNVVYSRPKFRKVQSESDLKSLCRASSGSAATFAAADSFNSIAPLQGYGDGCVQLRKLDRFCSASESAILEMSENSEDASSAGSEVSEEPREMPSMLNNSGYWNERTMTMGKQSSAQVPHQESQLINSQEDHYVPPLSSQDVSSDVSMLSTAAERNFLNANSRATRTSSNVHESSRRLEGTTSLVRSMSASTMEAPSRGKVLERSSYTSSQTENRGPMLITDIGFGIGGGGGGRGVSGGRGGGSGGGFGDSHGVEAQYQRMLEADPGHPLLLRNYAQFLHEVKRDSLKAESYYERAILANPGDAEVLGQYAQLIWEVYKDEDRAGEYFDQALQASPDDCYLNAAYASFLWSSEGDEEDEVAPPPEVCHVCAADYTNNMPPMYGAAAHV